jgi:hypothetical protein
MLFKCIVILYEELMIKNNLQNDSYFSRHEISFSENFIDIWASNSPSFDSN